MRYFEKNGTKIVMKNGTYIMTRVSHETQEGTTCKAGSEVTVQILNTVVPPKISTFSQLNSAKKLINKLRLTIKHAAW